MNGYRLQYVVMQIQHQKDKDKELLRKHVFIKFQIFILRYKHKERERDRSENESEYIEGNRKLVVRQAACSFSSSDVTSLFLKVQLYFFQEGSRLKLEESSLKTRKEL